MSTPTFTIAEDGKSITCLVCHFTSHNQNDITHRYCGHCHQFHGVESETEFSNRMHSVMRELAPACEFAIIVYPQNNKKQLRCVSTLEPGPQAELFALVSNIVRLMIEPNLSTSTDEKEQH